MKREFLAKYAFILSKHEFFYTNRAFFQIKSPEYILLLSFEMLWVYIAFENRFKTEFIVKSEMKDQRKAALVNWNEIICKMYEICKLFKADENHCSGFIMVVLQSYLHNSGFLMNNEQIVTLYVCVYI